MTRQVSRRDVLALLAAAAAAFGCGPTAARAGYDRRALTGTDGDEALRDWLQAALGDADLTAIASAWRAADPAATSAAALAAALLRGRRRGDTVQEHLARSVTADHAAGRTAILDGWVLSYTEGRLAALAEQVRVGLQSREGMPR